MDFDNIKFRDYVRLKFAEWRGMGRGSLKGYADYIGISQQVASYWYNGNLKNRPEPDTYIRLIEKYGIEVYDVLNLPRPMEISYEDFPPDVQSAISAAVAETNSIYASRHISPESPEVWEIARETFNKHLEKYSKKNG